MKLSNFQYTLPEELLAEYPSERRDEAKLMEEDIVRPLGLNE